LLVKPTHIVEHVTDIDLECLWEAGIRGFIFDLDNTIMAPHTGKLEDDVAHWLKKIETIGFKAIVVSNNPIKLYTQEAERVLNIPVLGNAGKPRRKHLRRAAEMLSLETHQVVVVGDRPLTDIWGGQRLGAQTILVDPLTKHKENALIKVLRRLERIFVFETPENCIRPTHRQQSK
jgi:uncharacterized protein